MDILNDTFDTFLHAETRTLADFLKLCRDSNTSFLKISGINDDNSTKYICIVALGETAEEISQTIEKLEKEWHKS